MKQQYQINTSDGIFNVENFWDSNIFESWSVDHWRYANERVFESPLEELAYCRLAAWLNDERIQIFPQYKVPNTKYRIDFLLLPLQQYFSPGSYPFSDLAIGIELDSWQFHGKAGKEKFTEDIKRKREIESELKIPIMTFSGKEIHNMDSQFEFEVEDLCQQKIRHFLVKKI